MLPGLAGGGLARPEAWGWAPQGVALAEGFGWGWARLPGPALGMVRGEWSR